MTRKLTAGFFVAIITVGLFVSGVSITSKVNAQVGCSMASVIAGTCGMTWGYNTAGNTVPGYCARSVSNDLVTSPQSPNPSIHDVVLVSEIMSPTLCPYLWNLNPDNGTNIMVLNPDTNVSIPIVPAQLGWNWTYNGTLPPSGWTMGLLAFELDGRSGSNSILVLKNSSDANIISGLIAKYHQITIRIGILNTVTIPMTVAPLAPVVSSVFPNPATVSTTTTITITGTGFDPLKNNIKLSNTASTLSMIIANTASTNNGTSITFKLPALAVAGTYNVQVSGQNGIYSNAVSLTLKNLVVAPSKLTAAMNSIGSVTLTWTDNTTDETGFQIERVVDDTSTVFVPIATVAANIKSYTDNLDTVNITGIQDRYRVRAIMSGGTYSDYSNVASVSNCFSMTSVAAGRKAVISRVAIPGSSMSSITMFKKYVDEVVKLGTANASSISVDLHNYSPLSFIADGGLYPATSDAYLTSNSACGSANQYVIFFNDPAVIYGIVDRNRIMSSVSPSTPETVWVNLYLEGANHPNMIKPNSGFLTPVNLGAPTV